MGYGTLIPALLFVAIATVLAFASMWIAQKSRRMDDAQRQERRRARERRSSVEVGPSEVTVFLRYERAGETAMRDVLAHLAPGGEIPADALPSVVEPMVDSLRLATHVEQLDAGPDVASVQSPVEGGVVTRLEVRSTAPLPRLEDPTARSALSGWLRGIAALDPTRVISVKLGEVFASPDVGAPALRPLHR
jgi:hypothetical protein